MSVSDISSKSTDSLLILTPVSSEVITRPDLPLFERQNNFRVEVRPSLSELSVNHNLELENKFSSTSLETVIEESDHGQNVSLKKDILLREKTAHNYILD